MAEEYLPMSETGFYILLSLVEEQHGYAVMQNTLGMTHGRIKLGAGTLYGTLSKMEQASVIQTTRIEGKRKYYRITDFGRKVLEAEVRRIEELYRNGVEVLGNEG